MGRIFDLTDFMGPSISLFYESIDSEQKAIITILLNSKSETQPQFL